MEDFPSVLEQSLLPLSELCQRGTHSLAGPELDRSQKGIRAGQVGKLNMPRLTVEQVPAPNLVSSLPPLLVTALGGFVLVPAKGLLR